MLSVAEQRTDKEQSKQDVGIIDCDVHPLVRGGTPALYRYVDAGWRRRFEYRGSALVPPSRYSHPGAIGNAIRADATTPSGEPGGADPDYMIEDWLGRFNVQRAVLLPLEAALVNASPYAAEAAVLASAYNNYFADEWLEKDRRFRLAMVVAPQDPRAAAKEINRFADRPGVVGVWVPLLNILLGNVHYHPIFEAALENDLPVIVHPVASACNFQGLESFAGGVPSHYCERHVGHMQTGVANLSSLVFEGVFDRYPGLRCIFAEFGWSWLAAVRWRMDSAWKAMRIEVPWVKKFPSEYIREFVRFTTQPIDEPSNPAHLQQIIEMCDGMNVLMFSSDYPHWDNDDPRRSFTAMESEFKERVFGQTAIEIYGERLLK